MRLPPRAGRPFNINYPGVKKPYPILYLLWLTSALLVGCASSKRTGYTPETTYTPDALLKDFTLLRKILEADHPSLYWYTSKDSMNYYFDQAAGSITKPMTETAFRNLLASTLAHIRCGHTGVRSSKQMDYYESVHEAPEFPFQVKILGADPQPQLALVFNPYVKDTMFKAGDILTQINGVPAPQLIDSMKRFLSVDGYSYNFAYQRISGDFPLFYQNTFGSDSIYDVGISRPGAAPFVAPVKAYDLQRDTALAQELKIWEMGAPTRFSNREALERERYLQIDSSGQLAVLNIRSFADGVSRRFIRQSFKTLRKEKVPNLVIDLRVNTGGVIRTAITLAKYLKPDDFVFTDSIYASTRHLAYRSYLDKGFLYQLGMTFLTHKESEGRYRFSYFAGKTYNPAKKNHYHGKVYILTGGFTFSAASIFAANMKGTPGVTVVGEETGGGYYGNDGVFITEATLPNTGLRVSLPLFRMIINHKSPKDGRGVLPDIEVIPTTADIRAAVDPKMKKVEELIGLHGVAFGPVY
jgi:hypothetical protein